MRQPTRRCATGSREALGSRVARAVHREFGKMVEEIAWGRRVRNPAAMELIRAEAVRSRIDEVLGR